MVEPNVEVKLPEALAIRWPALGFPRELAKAGKVGVAVGKAGVDRLPDSFVAPIAVLGRFEQDRQGRGIIDLTQGDTPGIVILFEGDVLVPTSCCGDDHVQRARRLHEAGFQGLPEVALFPSVQLVRENEGRGATVLRGTVCGDSLKPCRILAIGDPVPVARNLGNPFKAGVLPDEVRGFLKCDAGLLLVSGGAHHLSRDLPFGADRVKQGKSRTQSRFAVPSRHHQEHGLDDPGAVIVARAIDAANDPLEGRMQHEALAGEMGSRVPQVQDEVDRSLAVSQRIGDRAVIKHPGWIGLREFH